MALKSTIYKAELNVSDMDRGYYQSHSLTIAQHPSETLERMMLRIAVFARHAAEYLAFTKGISTVDEPDLWQKSLSDEIEVWIDLGQPDEKRIRKACGRAREVWIYCYGRAAPVWWQQEGKTLKRFGNLHVVYVGADCMEQLGTCAQRTMDLQCTVQDGELCLIAGDRTVTLELEVWQQPS